MITAPRTVVLLQYYLLVLQQTTVRIGTVALSIPNPVLKPNGVMAPKVWYSDPDLGRDRGLPSLDVTSANSRIILSCDGSVIVKRSNDDDPDSDRSPVEGLFLRHQDCPAEWLEETDSSAPLLALIGTKLDTDYWILDLPPHLSPSLPTVLSSLHPDWEQSPLRQFGDRMTRPDHSALYATANGLVKFHLTHPYCAQCGNPTRSAKNGACRKCVECRSSVYPRIDSATIMLVTSPRALDGGSHCLLGRKKNWPQGRWSTLAGFVEVGETLEECVSREVMEESDVRVIPDSVRFVASQPWPFPRSLMVGFTAEAEGGGEALPEIRFDPRELEDARWFSREYVAERLEGGSSALDFVPTTEEAEFHIPGRASLARVLIEKWALEKD